MSDTPDIPSPMAAALDRSDFPPSAKLAYGALRLADGPLTRVELAERTGLHRQTVKEATDALVAADWLTTDTRFVSGPGRNPETYRPLVPCPECNERFVGEQGVANHYGTVHSLSPSDLIGRAGEVGEDPSPPPKPGAEDG